VPLAELLNAIDATALAPSGGPASGHVVVRHPLQPFDPRNFTPGRLGQPHPFSFDPAGLAGARASLRKRRPAPPLVSRPLGPPPATESIALDDLADFLQHPVRGFLRQRLGVSRSRSDEEPDDALPIEVKGLKKWQIGTRALERCLDGVEEPLVARLEYLRGELPPGHLGNRAMQDIGAEITALLHESEPEREAPPRSEDVSVRMPDGRELTGTVSGIRADVLLDLRFSKMSPKYRLGLWVRYLSLVASGHAVTRALLVARARGPKAERATVAGVDQATAVRVLTELVQLRDEGLCAPLPIMEKTSERYASARRRGRPIGQALGFARREWAGNAYCESKDDDIVLVFGPDHPFASLTAEAACGAEAGWFTDEPSRFGALARRLWTPVLDFETDGQP
jgi:exodeoxyribonuclease V gamma subunit